MLPRRDKFPLLNNFHDLKHIVHDKKKPSIKDSEIIKLTKKEGRIIITVNKKTF